MKLKDFQTEFKKAMVKNFFDNGKTKGDKTKSNERYVRIFDTPLSKYVIEELFSLHKKFGSNDDFSFSHLNDIYVHSHLFGVCYETSAKYITDGRGDMGIDSYYFNEETKVLTLVQTKLSSLDMSIETEMRSFFSDYIEAGKELPKESLKLSPIVDLKKHHGIKDLKIILVSPNASKQEVDSYSRFGWSDILKDSVENINKNVFLKIKEFAREISKDSKNIIGKIIEDQSKNDKPTVIKMPVMHFIKELNNFNEARFESLFNSNVRADVTTSKKDFLEGFRETINSEPQNFEIFNNGITITCSNMESGKDGTIKVSNPQIINGQQTTRNLMKLSKLSDLGQSVVNLDDIYIYVKIIPTTDDSLIMKIARYSNTQAAIKVGDLISTTTEFKKLSKVCIDAGYFIEAREGESLRSTIYKKMKLQSIAISDLTKIYIAVNEPKKLSEAKSSIGAIKEYMVKNKKFSEITQDNIKTYYELLAKKLEFKKFYENKLFIDFKGEKDVIKLKKKIFNFAEMAIYKMLVDKKSNAKIYNDLSEYREKFTGDSLIQDFKSTKAYVDLGLIQKN